MNLKRSIRLRVWDGDLLILDTMPTSSSLKAVGTFSDGSTQWDTSTFKGREGAFTDVTGDTGGGELRVDFESKELVGKALDMCKIKVYNLNSQTSSRIGSKPNMRVKLEVRDSMASGYRTLFEGRTINIHATSSFEDHITTLYCWANLVYHTNSHEVQFTFPAESTINSMLDEVLADMNKRADRTIISKYLEVSKDVGDLLNVPVSHPVTTSRGTYLEVIQDILDYKVLTFSKSNSVIRIFKYPTRKGMLDKLSSDTTRKHSLQPALLCKPVEFSLGTATIDYTLSPDINPLDIVTIPNSRNVQTSLVGYDENVLSYVADATKILPNTTYYVTSVTHKGSCYTEDWSTSIAGMVYLDGVSEPVVKPTQDIPFKG